MYNFLLLYQVSQAGLELIGILAYNMNINFKSHIPSGTCGSKKDIFVLFFLLFLFYRMTEHLTLTNLGWGRGCITILINFHLYHLHKFWLKFWQFNNIFFSVIPSVVDRLGDAKKVVSDIFIFIHSFPCIIESCINCIQNYEHFVFPFQLLFRLIYSY